MKQLISDALDDYLLLRKSGDYSRQTLANESGVLKRFLSVTGNIWMHNVDERHVIRHFEKASQTRSSRSLQLDHTVLGQFFTWARQTRRLPHLVDPMAGRRRPKTRRKERDRVPVTRFADLLDVAGEMDPRNRGIVAVLLYLLIRDNECRDIRVGDVRLDTGYVKVTISKTYTEDLMPICAELDQELRLWLTHYANNIGRGLLPTDYLFPSRKTLTLVRSGHRGRIESHEMAYVPEQKVGRIGRFMGEVLEGVGFSMKDVNGDSKMEGSHTIRRSGARALFDRLAAEGYDRALRIVQSMLHHSSITTTELYIGVTADQRGRDEILLGKPMFPKETENVLQLSV